MPVTASLAMSAGLAFFLIGRPVLADVNLCGRYDFYNSTTVPYAFNNNAWGNTTTTASGYQCLDVLNGDKSFVVTYKWNGDPSVVKSYPYMKAHPSNLPVPLQNISRLLFSGSWSTYVSSTTNQSPDQQAQAFVDAGLLANVAVDMFLSDNATNSTLPGPPIEIMIWPWWIPSVHPLGWTESTPQVDTVAIAGTNFSLYHGFNDGGQHVFSWLAQQNVTSTNADYGPLLRYIWQRGMLSGALWVGQLEFGTEIKHAAEETRFEARNMTLRVVRQGDRDDVTTRTTSTAGVTPTAAATRVTPTSGGGGGSVATTPTSSTTSTSRSAAGRRVVADGWLVAVLLGVAQLRLR